MLRAHKNAPLPRSTKELMKLTRVGNFQGKRHILETERLDEVLGFRRKVLDLGFQIWGSGFRV